MREYRALLFKAVKRYGKSQIILAVEEMSELIVELLHHLRGRPAKGVTEEIADVMIMMEQLRMLFGEEEVDNWIEIKTNRLQARIMFEEYEEKNEE